MDFIERLFGISPDGGSGLTEFGVLLAIAAVLLVVKWRALIVRPVGRVRR